MNNINDQKLYLISLQLSQNELTELENTSLSGAFFFTYVNQIFSSDEVIDPIHFKHLKKKIQEIRGEARSPFVNRINKLIGSIFSASPASINLLKKIETQTQEFKNQENYQTVEALIARLDLLNPEDKIDQKIAIIEKIIKNIGSLEQFGVYSQDGEFLKYQLTDREKQLFKRLISVCQDLEKYAKKEDAKKVKPLTKQLRNCMNCAEVGLNPQLILNEKSPKDLSSFLFQKRAIYTMKHFHVNVGYKLEEGEYVPYLPCAEKKLLCEETKMRNMQSVVKQVATMGDNEWAILKNGFQTRSRDHWTKLEPVMRKENWKGGCCLEVGTYIPYDLFGILSDQHSAVRLIDNAGNVYSIGISGNIPGGINILTSPDWRLFSSQGRQEVISRYSLSQEGLLEIIKGIEERQKATLVIADLEKNNMNIVTDHLKDAEKKLKDAKEVLLNAKDECDIRDAQADVKAKEEHLSKMQAEFDEAKTNFMKQLNEIEINNNDSVSDNIYFVCRNNCSSFANSILEKAKGLGAKPVLIEKSELKENQKTHLSPIERVALRVSAVLSRVVGFIAVFFRKRWVNKTYLPIIDYMLVKEKRGVIAPAHIALQSLADNAIASRQDNKPLNACVLTV